MGAPERAFAVREAGFPIGADSPFNVLGKAESMLIRSTVLLLDAVY
jgi:hypothetical protein